MLPEPTEHARPHNFEHTRNRLMRARLATWANRQELLTRHAREPEKKAHLVRQNRKLAYRDARAIILNSARKERSRHSLEPAESISYSGSHKEYRNYLRQYKKFRRTAHGLHLKRELYKSLIQTLHNLAKSIAPEHTNDFTDTYFHEMSLIRARTQPVFRDEGAIERFIGHRNRLVESTIRKGAGDNVNPKVVWAAIKGDIVQSFFEYDPLYGLADDYLYHGIMEACKAYKKRNS